MFMCTGLHASECVHNMCVRVSVAVWYARVFVVWVQNRLAYSVVKSQQISVLGFSFALLGAVLQNGMKKVNVNSAKNEVCLPKPQLSIPF